MPPRTRTAKSTKTQKENIGISSKPKLKSTDRVTKPPRKVLGDKTNSASDDNASIDIPNKPSKTPISDIKLTNLIQNTDAAAKPRRERRVPSRFVDSNILKNKENLPVSSSSNNDKNGKKVVAPVVKTTNTDTKSSVKNDSSIVSPFKTPQKVPEASLVASRPRRVSRLPSRFEDHSMSPSKFVPVQPCHASTPIAPKILKTQEPVQTTEKNDAKTNQKDTSTPKVAKAKPGNKKTSKPDTNNNAKGRTLRNRKVVEEKSSTRSKKSPVKSDNSKTEKHTAKELVTPQNAKLVQSKIVSHTVKKVASPLKEKAVTKTVVTPATPAKKLVTPQKAKLVQSKIVSPAKKITSRTQKSPVKLPSPVKHSYLKTLNNNSSFVVETVRSPVKPSSPVKKPNLRAIKKDLSFKVLEENKKKECDQDVYEFTFDPTEEPAPQKKKRKVTKRKPAKPKPRTVTFKNNYDQNVNKALAALKNAVTKKAPLIAENVQKPISVEANKITTTPSNGLNGEIISPKVQRNVASKIIIGNTQQTTRNNVQNKPQIQQNVAYKPIKVISNVSSSAAPIPGPSQSTTPFREPDQSIPLSEPNQSRTTFPHPNQSVRVEDIAADFDTSPQHDIDYSPVNSPMRPKTPVNQISRISDIHHHNDPLNLRENISFDPNPIASSSMNTSVRLPQPSPWRAEFDSLPIRWHVNSYVKPNMTPAVECSFVNFDDKNKKKHVYTNILPHNNEDLPEIVQKDQPNVIQSSIISFFKEVVDKSSSKKKRGRSVTPVTASLFNETADVNKDDDKVKQSTRQLFTPKKNDNARTDTSNQNSSKDASTDKENSKDSSRGRKRKNNEEANNATPAKTRKEKDDKYFGFDDSENLENVSPTKEIGRKKSLRQAHARAVLKERNALNQPAPTRAVIPVAVKTARMAEVERLYDEMKSASDAPEIPAKEPTAANELLDESNEDTQTSVHLFHDVEDIVHHLKPQRKSYGKAKKVTFMRKDSSDTQDSDLRPEPASDDDEEDLHDLTFNPGLPLLDENKKKTKKKTSKRQKMSKKEEEEAEAWAAGFNSMCEDVEDFPLLVE